jgi:hypothetical protein
MTLEQAKQILKANGRPSCPCKYQSEEKMIEEAKKLVK